ncbi:MAG: phosphoribosylanthranilate isomerase [Coriobacteriales bacterium]|nr:phosphoribosylanthranilate isomerase [Coriobacteriales bacterium]
MDRTRIKICGLTTAEDAAAAVAAGVDACGAVFAPSPRQVAIGQAERVFAEVTPPVGRIGVFVDADPGFVAEAVRRCSLTAVQFHGSESPEACSAAPVPVIKAIRIGTVFDSSALEPYLGHVAAVLLDKLSTRNIGGTGETFPWHLITDVPGRAPAFLAGGLTSDNVREAIRTVRPFAVDACSGVEAAPGVKDLAELECFIATVRAADDELRAEATGRGETPRHPRKGDSR